MKKRLEICKMCNHKKVNFERGILCSLTNEKPNFIDVCNDFSENESAKKDAEFKRKKKERESISTGIILLLSSFLVYFGLPWVLIKVNLYNFIPSENILKTISFIIAGVGIYSLLKIVNFNSKSINDIEKDKSLINNEGEEDTVNSKSFDRSQNNRELNKVVNVTLKGGIIGMLADSPHSSLHRRIRRENANGWQVVQVIPSSSGNILLIIFRVILLIITLFFFTTANGYYIIMKKMKE